MTTNKLFGESGLGSLGSSGLSSGARGLATIAANRQAAQKPKQDLDDLLNQVRYGWLNSSAYMPGKFALTFMNFIKLVNGEQGESNKTPPMHLAMLDNLENRTGNNLANLLFRGAAKALALDTPILTPVGYVPMGKVFVGMEVFDRTGAVTHVTHVSEVFDKPAYRVKLVDGTEFVASEDHLHIVRKWDKQAGWVEEELTTLQLLGTKDYSIPLVQGVVDFPEQETPESPYTHGEALRERGGRIGGKYLYNSQTARVELLRGLSGDGATTNEPYGHVTFLHESKELVEDVQELVKSLGGWAKMNEGYTLRGKEKCRLIFNLSTVNPFSEGRKATKWEESKGLGGMQQVGIASIEPVVEGVKTRCIAVASGTKSYLIKGCTVTHNTSVFMEYLSLYLATFGHLPKLGKVSGMIYVSDSMENGVKNARKNIEFRYNNSEFIQQWVPHAKFTDNFIEFANRDGHQLGIKMFGAKSGLRGSKIYGKRPILAVLDDLVSDEDAHSKASMEAIMDTVYKGVNHALDPNKRLTILNGTPFHKDDLMVSAVESGGWHVNVWPVCERFPCPEEEFQSAWPDRFTYAFVKEQYDFALANGRLAAFNQELMLRITSEEDRLIQEGEIRWYSRAQLLKNKHNFNFYITTDFATSEKQKADYSVVSVWAYNSEGDWFWVDGTCTRQTMDKSIDDLFRFVQEYRPQQVGIEVTGQQGAFIQWLQQEQMNRNLWFNFASSNQNGAPGVRPTANKLQRFNVVVPWFKAGKMYFPQEMKHSDVMGIAMDQLRLATKSGLKGKDDFIDTISMLASLKPWKPSEQEGVGKGDTGSPAGMWDDERVEEHAPIESYIV